MKLENKKKTVKKVVAPKIVVSDEMKRRICNAALSTWSVIHYDVQKAIGGRVKLEDAIEFVGDADRMKMYGRDNEAYDFFMKLDYKTQDKLLKEALKGRV